MIAFTGGPSAQVIFEGDIRIKVSTWQAQPEDSRSAMVGFGLGEKKEVGARVRDFPPTLINLHFNNPRSVELLIQSLERAKTWLVTGKVPDDPDFLKKEDCHPESTSQPDKDIKKEVS